MKRNRTALAALALLFAAPGSGRAACSNAAANAKAQEFAALVKQKMPTKPDETGDLAAEFGDAMSDAAGAVTDDTCARLDALVRKARAL